MSNGDKEQHPTPEDGPYVPPVIYDPKRGVMVNSKTGETVIVSKKDKPWEGAPRTDAIWKRHTEDAAALEDRSKELSHYYEMASHACDLERENAQVKQDIIGAAQRMETAERELVEAHRKRIANSAALYDMTKRCEAAERDLSARPSLAALDALRELVACKDLKERIVELDDPMNWKDPPELEPLQAEYHRRQPEAWKAARAIVAGTPPSPRAAPHLGNIKVMISSLLSVVQHDMRAAAEKDLRALVDMARSHSATLDMVPLQQVVDMVPSSSVLAEASQLEPWGDTEPESIMLCQKFAAEIVRIGKVAGDLAKQLEDLERVSVQSSTAAPGEAEQVAHLLRKGIKKWYRLKEDKGDTEYHILKDVLQNWPVIEGALLAVSATVPRIPVGWVAKNNNGANLHFSVAQGWGGATIAAPTARRPAPPAPR